MISLKSLKDSVSGFLAHQAGRRPGYFKFSYSGDLYGENDRWGLDASAFAVKLYQMLRIEIPRKEEWISFIKSFENSSGEIFDRLILSKSAAGNALSAIRRGYFGNFLGLQTRRAQTRQSWATLLILGGRPARPYKGLPNTPAEVDLYLNKLNWRSNPWNAASHAGQLLSFYGREQKFFGKNRQELIEYTIKRLNEFQNSEDGAWHRNINLPNNIRVNAAMKIISGLSALLPASGGRYPIFAYPEKLIDLCLNGKSDSESCSTVDRIYVLYYASRLTEYRLTDIRAFAEAKMKQYEDNFRREGGFSFFPNNAQEFYLGARITRGYNEPDMQGTALGVWGIVLLAHILDFPEKNQLILPTI